MKVLSRRADALCAGPASTGASGGTISPDDLAARCSTASLPCHGRGENPAPGSSASAGRGSALLWTGWHSAILHSHCPLTPRSLLREARPSQPDSHHCHTLKAGRTAARCAGSRRSAITLVIANGWNTPSALSAPGRPIASMRSDQRHGRASATGRLSSTAGYVQVSPEAPVAWFFRIGRGA